MVRPPREAIDTFVGITGADEAVAVRTLEEYSGDLNEAVNAFFNEGDRTTTRINQNSMPATASHDDMMDLDEPFGFPFPRPFYREASRGRIPYLDPHFLARAAGSIANQGPHVTHPREVRQIPIEVKDNNLRTGSSGQSPLIEDVTGHESLYDAEIHGTAVFDEDYENLPSPHAPNIPTNTSSSNYSVPSALPWVDVNNDVEEEMIRAAIEASKRDAEGLANGLNNGERENALRGRDDDEIAQAVSRSLQTAERERVLCNEGMHVVDHSSDLSDKEDIGGASGTVERQGRATKKTGTSGQLIDEEIFEEDIEDVEEQPLVRERFRHIPSGNAESTEATQRIESPSSSLHPQSIQNDNQNNGSFPSEEWGGISSQEHDEAVMLEAAMFGVIPGGATYPFSFPSHGNTTPYPRVARPPSPTLTAQRLLREQQDDEYLAALQADREKELKAVQEAELRKLEEAASRAAAIEKQKQEEEEKLRKQLEEEELESKLADKQAALPKEPLPNDEGAVTIVVRMPDGSRQGRRFLKSDKLQVLFDFIDITRTFKPGTYRLVMSYPRRAFTDAECQMSLSDLGLTSKQEALFLEQISG